MKFANLIRRVQRKTVAPLMQGTAYSKGTVVIGPAGQKEAVVKDQTSAVRDGVGAADEGGEAADGATTRDPLQKAARLLKHARRRKRVVSVNPLSNANLRSITLI